jgi:molybdopterin-guanine dinucleotide biosynthesis protein B
MRDVDLLLVEGFKREAFDKLEVHRQSVGKPLLAPEDPNIVAIAVDKTIADFDRPQLDINDVVRISDFIVERCALPTRQLRQPLAEPQA